MTILIAGLILFLGIHSVRLISDAPRAALVSKLGARGYQGLYSVLSLAGLVLIVIGYGQTRVIPVDIWYPDGSRRGLAVMLTLLSFILLASNEPGRDKGGYIKRVLRHPMTLGIMVWASAHLLVNGRLGDIVLFGSFFVWAALLLIRRLLSDHANKAKGIEPAPVAQWQRDMGAVIGGTIVWALIAFFLHPWLIGVSVI